MPEFPSGTVAFLFTDIEGSTKRWERDPAAMWAAIERHFTLLDDAIAASDGVLFKTLSRYTDPTTPGSAACACSNTDHPRELVPTDDSVAREHVSVDHEIRREDALKKGWPDGHPSPDCLRS
jgi:class 3 adenylate cyclase